MAFKLVSDPTDTQMVSLPISSLTLSVGDMLELDAGATTWTVADSSTQHWQKKAVVQEAATSSATEVKAILVEENQKWEVETVNNSAAADNFDRMVLTDQNTVNNTGTDSTAQTAVFIQIAPVGAAALKKVVGWFVAGTGVDPDAA